MENTKENSPSSFELSCSPFDGFHEITTSVFLGRLFFFFSPFHPSFLWGIPSKEALCVLCNAQALLFHISWPVSQFQFPGAWV
mmetsp:Transcript_13151/g.19857  ORF Transcript_13151/g.19857 Transcript_13151/m.19857 type:complete len:83 (+) Transcript_13151:61-309(+)